MMEEYLSKDKFTTLSYSTIVNYLEANDWLLEKDINDDVSIFSKKGKLGKRQLVWIPKRTSSSDYFSMIVRAIKGIADAESKFELQIIDDLNTIAIGDVIRIHTYDDVFSTNESITLDAGIGILNQTRHLALSAVSSLIQKRPVHPRKPSFEAKQFIKNLRIGHTEKGSYLIKIISPFSIMPKSYEEGYSFSRRIPFERRVIVELMSSLSTLYRLTSQVLDSGKYSFKNFVEEVPRGISANLCESIIPQFYSEENVQQNSYSPIELDVTWSYLVKDKTLPLKSTVAFSPAMYPILWKVAKEFRLRNPEYMTVKGWVNILERDTRRGPGHIRILTKIDEKLKHVRLNLLPEDYDLAIDAHKKGLIVSVSGILEITRNIFSLNNPENFHILDSDIEQMDLDMNDEP